jgi:hypothetical protein
MKMIVATKHSSLLSRRRKKSFYETLATEVPVKISLKSPTVSPSFEQSVKVKTFLTQMPRFSAK